MSITHPTPSRIDNYGVGVVVRSESTKFQVGDHAYGFMSQRSQPLSIPYSSTTSTIYPVMFSLELQKCLERLRMWDGTSTRVLTNFFPFHGAFHTPFRNHLSQNEIVFVSDGASPVGSYVATGPPTCTRQTLTTPRFGSQFAKMQGLTVIALAGSGDKVKVMKSI